MLQGRSRRKSSEVTVQSDLGFASLSAVVPRCRDLWRAAKRRVEGRPGSNERRFLSLAALDRQLSRRSRSGAVLTKLNTASSNLTCSLRLPSLAGDSVAAANVTPPQHGQQALCKKTRHVSIAISPKQCNAASCARMQGPWDLGTIDRTRTYKGRQNHGVILFQRGKERSQKRPKFQGFSRVGPVVSARLPPDG